MAFHGGEKSLDASAIFFRALAAAALPPPANQLPYEGGLIVQSGPRPQMGDATLGRKPLEYVAVNRVLKGLRATDTRAFHHANGGQRLGE